MSAQNNNKKPSSKDQKNITIKVIKTKPEVEISLDEIIENKSIEIKVKTKILDNDTGKNDKQVESKDTKKDVLGINLPSANLLTIAQQSELKPMSSNRFIGEENYEKLSFVFATILLIKCAFGLGVFSSCYGFAQVGYVLGTIICLVMCYICCYGMYTMGNLANSIERDNEGSNLSLKTYHDTAMACVSDSYKFPIKIITIIDMMLVNL